MLDKIYKINPTIDIDLAYQHKFIIDNQLNDEYISLQKKYYLILEKYLCQLIKLKDYERQLKETNYFKISQDQIKKKLDIEAIDLNYFFIRNNLNIECLSLEEINLLKNSDNFNELYRLIEMTFLKVIKVNKFYGRDIGMSKISYDGTSKESLKFNNSLVIGFVYNLDDIQVTDDEWEEYNYNKETLKKRIFSSIYDDCIHNLECKVEFIEYWI